MCGIHWCDAQHVRGAHTNRQKAYEKASVFILARRVKTSTALSKGMFWRDYQNISLLLAHSSFIKMRELKWYLSNPPFRKWCQNWHPPTKHFDLYWVIQFSYKHSQGKRVCPAFPEVLFLKSCLSVPIHWGFPVKPTAKGLEANEPWFMYHQTSSRCTPGPSASKTIQQNKSSGLTGFML